MSATRRQRGGQRKPDYVTTWGETIHGAYMSADGRLRPIGLSTPAFGPATDERLAVHRFRLWQRQQNPSPDGRDDCVDYQVEGKDYAQQEKEHIRHLLLTDLRAAAAYMDVPFLADYPKNRHAPQYTLIELGQYYLANKRNKQGKPLNGKHRANQERFWQAFCDHVAVKYPRELTQALVSSYRDSVMQRYDAGDYAADTVRARFVCVKAVLNYGFSHTDDKEDLRIALDFTTILQAPASACDPNPIQPADFLKLHDAASTRERAMLLVGLNCLMHGGEVCNLKTSDISLSKQTLISRRSKTGLPRVAYLWDRTVSAIRQYQQEYPHQSEYVFVSANGTAMSSEGLRQRIVALRKRAGVSADVTFDLLRDAGYTIADECDTSRARYIAGHKVAGKSDAYILRQADSPRVKACCLAIEKAFFPKSTPKGKGKGKQSQ